MLQQIISRKASCPFVAYISNESENSNHFHNELELVFLLSGRMTYLIGGIQYNLKARDFILANPYELHSVSFVSDDCSYVHILIQESRLRIQKSIYALCHTNSYIADIAEDCGSAAFTQCTAPAPRVPGKLTGVQPIYFRMTTGTGDLAGFHF